MRFRCAQFKNFRLLRDVHLDFAGADDRRLTVIRAENDTGKTTILTGLQWVLFGEDSLPGSADTFRLHPIDWDVAESGPLVDIEVEVEFEHPVGSILEIYSAKRTASEKLTGNDAWERETGELQLLRKSSNGWFPVPAGTGLLTIRSIMGSAVRDLFFTDGDRALSFITADISQNDKRKLVQRALRDMLGFEVLQNAIKHTNSAVTAMRKRVGSSAVGGLGDAAKTIEAIDKNLQAADEERDKAEREAENLSRDHAALDQRIELTLEKGDKEALAAQLRKSAEGIKRERDQLDRARAEHSSVFKSRTLSDWLCGAAIIGAGAYLDELKSRGKLPRTAAPILRERLELGLCICGTPLIPGSEPHKHLLATIEEQEQASEVDDRLTTLRVRAAQLRGEKAAAQWLEEQATVIRSRQECQRRLTDLEHEHKELDNRIDGIPDTDLVLLRSQRTQVRVARDNAQKRAALANAKLDRLRQEKKEAERKYDDQAKKSKDAERIRCRLQAAQDVETVLSGTFGDIEATERPAVSSAMNAYFLEMIGSDEQASIIRRAEVTPDFDIVVYGPEMRRLDPDRDLNGASRRALTVAFILALAETSGVQAPNVIDTPLGMMSPQIKRKVLEVAVEHSRQLVLLLTRSEIRDTEDLLDTMAGLVFTLTNSAHYPKLLVNRPAAGGRRIERCECDHRQFCSVCERVGDADHALLSRRGH